MAKKNTPSFEESLKTLESIVKSMDSGDLSLEESLQAFEKGIGLVRQCQELLQTAEQKVQLLSEQNGQLTSNDFKDSDNE